MIILEDFQNWLYFFFGTIFLVTVFERFSRNLTKIWGVKLWEILIPASNNYQEFSYEHHKIWDDFVVTISGGITIMKTAKGQWISPNNIKFTDRMIPVRIKCSNSQIRKIIKFTISHYNQEAVIAYKISNKVILINKNKLSE